jgi:ribosomal protein L7/L12
VGLFGGSSDRGDLLALENRVARLEEQVALLTATLAARPIAPVVERVDDGGAADVAEPDPAPVDDVYAEARALAAEGNKIQAIQAVREQGGMSLRAAKDLVESW